MKSPKVYICDSGLLHFLNGIHSQQSLFAHPAVGASWEGYVINEICKQLPYSIKPYYYRTHHGAEADLILTKGITPIACIEIKYSLSPEAKTGFYNCMDDLGTKHNYIIYPGKDEYKKSGGNVTVVPVFEFITEHLHKIIK